MILGIKRNAVQFSIKINTKLICKGSWENAAPLVSRPTIGLFHSALDLVIMAASSTTVQNATSHLEKLRHHLVM